MESQNEEHEKAQAIEKHQAVEEKTKSQSYSEAGKRIDGSVTAAKTKEETQSPSPLQ